MAPKMTPKWLPNRSKLGLKSVPKQFLHANASSPSARAQKPLRKPIWDRFGAHLGSIWAPFLKDFGPLWTYKEDLDMIMDRFLLPMSHNIPI